MAAPVTHLLDRLSKALEHIQTSNQVATGLIEEHKEINDELSGIKGQGASDQDEAKRLRHRRAVIEDELLGMLRDHMRI